MQAVHLLLRSFVVDTLKFQISGPAKSFNFISAYDLLKEVGSLIGPAENSKFSLDITFHFLKVPCISLDLPVIKLDEIYAMFMQLK